MSDPYRRNLADLATQTRAAETAIEITYSDQLFPHVSLQPDLQWVFAPAGERARSNLLVLGLRLSITS